MAWWAWILVQNLACEQAYERGVHLVYELAWLLACELVDGPILDVLAGSWPRCDQPGGKKQCSVLEHCSFCLYYLSMVFQY